MQQRKLKTVVWLARLGSFRAVAERLNTTQAAISQRISAIENELGVVLFERNSRFCQLTAKGKEILPLAEQIVDLSNEITARIASDEKYSGTIRLGSVETVAHVWLPSFIERFQARYPAATLELNVDTSSVLLKSVMSGALDIAFIVEPGDVNGLAKEGLGHFEFCWAASPRLGLHQRVIGLEELAKFPLVTFSKMSTPYAFIIEEFRYSKLPMPPRINTLRSLSTSVKFCTAGAGIGFLPLVAIQDELQRGELHVLGTDLQSRSFEYVAIHNGNSMHPLVQSVVELAKDASDLARI